MQLPGSGATPPGYSPEYHRRQASQRHRLFPRHNGPCQQPRPQRCAHDRL